MTEKEAIKRIKDHMEVHALKEIMAQKLVEANCPYLKVGERIPNLRIDDSEKQLRSA